MAEPASGLEAAIRVRLSLARAVGWAGAENWSLDTTSPYGPRLITGPGEDDHWDRDVESVVWTCEDEDDGCPEMARSLISEGRHMAANDPATVIRGCEADLERLAEHGSCDGCRTFSPHSERWCHYCDAPAPCREMRRMAGVYSVTVEEEDQ